MTAALPLGIHRNEFSKQRDSGLLPDSIGAGYDLTTQVNFHEGGNWDKEV